MRGTVTAWLADGPHAGAFVQVEAVDGDELVAGAWRYRALPT